MFWGANRWKGWKSDGLMVQDRSSDCVGQTERSLPALLMCCALYTTLSA